MMVNEIERKPPRGGPPSYVDRGVRMHGSSRGFGYELRPPVPVQVLEGQIKGPRKQPLQVGQPLPPGYEL